MKVAAGKHDFSLVEVTVVIAIMAVLCSMAMVQMRSESPGARFEKALQGFRFFALRCKNIAAEQGKDIGIYYIAGENCCRAKVVKSLSFLRNDESYWINNEAPPEYILREFSGEELNQKFGIHQDTEEDTTLPQWEIPEDIIFTFASTAGDDTETPSDGRLCVIYFAGGGVSGEDFFMESGSRKAHISHSQITAIMQITSGDDQ